jgi:hypothetical protein
MADEMSSNWVTVHYNQEKLLDFVAVRRAEMTMNQLEETRSVIRSRRIGLGDEQRTTGRLKCNGEQRNSYIRNFLIQN